MPASIVIKRWCGSSGTPVKSDITNQNTLAGAQDVHVTGGLSGPIQLDVSETYSFWVSTRLCADTAPVGTINNLRWYCDAVSLPSDVSCIVQLASSYVQATGTVDSGIELTMGNHAGLTGAPVDLATVTFASPLVPSGSISSPTTGDFGSFVVYQFVVQPAAVPSTISPQSLVWEYDET